MISFYSFFNPIRSCHGPGNMTLLDCCEIFVSGRLGDSVVLGVRSHLFSTGGRGANLITEGCLEVGKRSVAGVGGGD